MLVVSDNPPSFFQKNRYIIVMSVLFSIAGIIYARMYWPELSWIQSLIGGISFGVFCMMCAANYRLYE